MTVKLNVLSVDSSWPYVFEAEPVTFYQTGQMGQIYIGNRALNLGYSTGTRLSETLPVFVPKILYLRRPLSLGHSPPGLLLL